MHFAQSAPLFEWRGATANVPLDSEIAVQGADMGDSERVDDLATCLGGVDPIDLRTSCFGYLIAAKPQPRRSDGRGTGG